MSEYSEFEPTDAEPADVDWSSYGSLGPTGELIDNVEDFSADYGSAPAGGEYDWSQYTDFGSDAPTGEGPYDVPGVDPGLAQVLDQSAGLAGDTQDYVDSIGGTGGYGSASSGTDAVLGIVNTVGENAGAIASGELNDEQIAGLNEQAAASANLAGALAADDEITTSVEQSQQQLLDDNYAHEQIRAADQALIYGQAVESESEG